MRSVYISLLMVAVLLHSPGPQPVQGRAAMGGRRSSSTKKKNNEAAAGTLLFGSGVKLAPCQEGQFFYDFPTFEDHCYNCQKSASKRGTCELGGTIECNTCFSNHTYCDMNPQGNFCVPCKPESTTCYSDEECCAGTKCYHHMSPDVLRKCLSEPPPQ